ncbi:trypco2 family protein [Streptomyces aureus]
MIELATFVRELREQLNSALSEPNPGPVRFELGPVEIEATVAVEQHRGASGKISLWVVEANADATIASTHTHRITMTLQPVLIPPDGSHRSIAITGQEHAGER